MNLLRQYLRRLRALFHKQALEDDMAEEMRLHLAYRAEQNVADGMTPEEARFAAQRTFGGIEQAKEEVRDARGWRWLEDFTQDLRHAFRQLNKARGYAAIAILILALGIGASTALFNVTYAVLLNPFPYTKPTEIWCPDFHVPKTNQYVGINTADYAEILRLPGIASAMASTWTMATLVSGQNADFVKVVHMSESAFGFLGVPPLLGRGIGPGDVQPSGEIAPVTVISYRLWQRLFHGSPDVIGRTLTLNDKPYVIVGVAPLRFTWKTLDGLWIPLSPSNKQIRWLNPNLRLNPGVSPQGFEEQLITLFGRITKDEPKRFPAEGIVIRLANFVDNINVANGELSSSLHLLFYAVGFLLLIACANVANLQLARSASRGREFAIRLAVGAGRVRLVRQLLTESLALSLAGGAGGVLLAFGLTAVIVRLIPPVFFPTEADVTMNGAVLAFSVGVSVFTGLVFGLAPALYCTRPTLNAALKDGGPSPVSAAGPRPQRLRSVLVVTEVALAVILLVGANLTLRGFLELQAIDPGFRPEQMLLLNLPLRPQRYPSLENRNAFAHDLLQRLQAMPQVSSAAIGMLPSTELGLTFSVPDMPAPERRIIMTNLVSSGYRQTLGASLVAGRDLTELEVKQGSRVALINESAVKLWPPGTSPLGRTLHLNRLADPPAAALASQSPGGGDLTIVGIIGDTRNTALRGSIAPVLFVPYTLLAVSYRSLLVRTEGDPARLLGAVRTELRALDPEQPLFQPVTADQVMDRQTNQPRFNLALFGGLALLGLVLACAGIYSVLSYHATQRAPEFGVRMVLGATPGDVWRLMLGEGTRLLAAGLLLGLAGSLALASFVTSRVFLVPLLDPFALAAAALVLGATTLLACFPPARRATRVNLLVALRHE